VASPCDGDKMRSKINFMIDALMSLVLLAITGFGFLMKYVLIPGKDRMAHFGRNVDLYFLGMDRHEWGVIHLILGYVLLGLLVLHLALHWKLIQSLFRRLIRTTVWHVPVISIFLILCVFLLIFPFLIYIEVREAAQGGHHHGHDIAVEETASAAFSTSTTLSGSNQSRHTDQTSMDSSIELHGRLTLAQVSDIHQIPVSDILNGLKIPGTVSVTETLGHLRKHYHFHMSDVVRVIQQYKSSQTR